MGRLTKVLNTVLAYRGNTKNARLQLAFYIGINTDAYDYFFL